LAGFSNGSKWHWNTKLFTDTPCCEILYFSVARYGSALVRRRVFPDRMFRTFTDKAAAILL
jgi:hypothetical protein